MSHSLSAALDLFHETLARHDPRLARLLDDVGPVSATRLARIEAALNGRVPEPVRELLERHDGSLSQPISPRRDDYLMCAEEIAERLEAHPGARIVPFASSGMDPETGITETIGVAVDDPWGPLWIEGLETRSAVLDLNGWLTRIADERGAHQPRFEYLLAPGEVWQPCEAPDEAALVAAPVGTAFAAPVAVGSRTRTRLWIKLAPDTWADPMSLEAEPGLPMVMDACRTLEREMRREPSLWAQDARAVALALAERTGILRGTVRVR